MYENTTSWAKFFQEVVFLVKGISRQVIVVQSPDPKLFEQAIFILRDDAVNNKGVTDEALLKEAKRLMGSSNSNKKKKYLYSGVLWACSGALVTGLAWVLSLLI